MRTTKEEKVFTRDGKYSQSLKRLSERYFQVESQITGIDAAMTGVEFYCLFDIGQILQSQRSFLTLTSIMGGYSHACSCSNENVLEDSSDPASHSN